MRCNICFLPIHDEANQLSCPFCQNPFHRDHLAAWLLNENKCPVCRLEHSPEFIEKLKPKNEKEKKELEQTLLTLKGLGNVLESWENSFKNRGRIKKMRTTVIENENRPSMFSIFMKFGLPIILFAIWIAILVIIFL